MSEESHPSPRAKEENEVINELDEQLLNETNGELQENSTPEKGQFSQRASPNDLESENSIHVAEETDSLSTNGHLSTNEQFNKVKGDFLNSFSSSIGSYSESGH